jgi:hypothetical protein
MAVKTWVWVTLGVVVVAMGGCLTLVGTGVYLVSRNVHVSDVSARSADEEFGRVVDRFPGQVPLLSIDKHGWSKSDALEERLKAPDDGRRATLLHILVWQADEEKLVRLAVPFWLIRMSPNKFVHLDLDEFDVGRLEISPADLERLGSALLLDHHDRRGRILLWSE